jgi:serine/threonine protein kinase
MMLTQILLPDIKPENILLQANGYLLLSDFGVAKILQDVEDCRSTSGTHGYMVTTITFEAEYSCLYLYNNGDDATLHNDDFYKQAPEIYLPHHRHGTAADWFALGVTLHEFVTGRRPFETSKLQAFRNGEMNAGMFETYMNDQIHPWTLQFSSNFPFRKFTKFSYFRRPVSSISRVVQLRIREL